MGSVPVLLTRDRLLLKSFCRSKYEPTGVPGVCSLRTLAGNVEFYTEVREPVRGLATGYLKELAEMRGWPSLEFLFLGMS